MSTQITAATAGVKWGDTYLVDTTPVSDFLAFQCALHGSSAIAAETGFDEAAIRRLAKPGRATLDRLDRLACALGRPDLINVHYGDVA